MLWSRKAHPDPVAEQRPLLRCTFCNKHQRHVKKLIAGPNVYICDECVDICVDILREDRLLDPGHPQAQPFPEPAVVCSVCGNLTPVAQGLQVPSRGILCSSCVAAIESALTSSQQAGV